MNDTDYGLETLLALNGEVFPMDNGYWTKFEARSVTVTQHIPYGISYSLTLHDRSNVRIFGIDNAHGFKPKKKKFGARIVTWDHKHKENRVLNYEFETPGQLLEDFWKEVELILKEV